MKQSRQACVQCMTRHIRARVRTLDFTALVDFVALVVWCEEGVYTTACMVPHPEGSLATFAFNS
jgi:hypothetical protein